MLLLQQETKKKIYPEFLRDIFSVLKQINYLHLMIYYLQTKIFSKFVKIMA